MGTRVQDVIDAHVMPEEARQALRAELVIAVEDGAYRGMRKEANRMIRTLDRRLAVHIGLGAGGAFVTGALAVLGLLAVTGHRADITGMTCHDQDGGRVCYVWVTPPPEQQGKR